MPSTAGSNQFATGLGNNGVLAYAQPAFSNISGTIASGQVSGSYTGITGTGTLTAGATGAGFTVALTTSTVTGNLPCANTPALAGDVTSSAGSCTTVVGNLPTATTMAGYLLATEIAAPTTPAASKVKIWTDSTDARLHDINPAGTIGTTAVANAGTTHQFFTAMSAAGVFSLAQPAFTDISGTIATGQVSGSYTGITAVGTIATGTWQGTNVDLAHGGTNASLTASNGGIFYSTGSAAAILAGTVTAGQCLLSGSNAAPTWGSCSGGGAAVSSVTAGDTSLTISPTTGAVVAQINLANADTWTGQHTWNVATTVASASGANLDDINIQAATSTLTGTTTVTKFNKVSFYRPTFTDASAVTVTDAATVYIDNAPLAAGSVTLTHTWALRVGTGATQLQATTLSGALTYGGVTLSNAVTGTGNMVLATAPSVSSLTVTTAFTATGLVTNADLANSSLTIGSTSVSLGATVTSFSGVTLSSPTFSGTVAGAGTIPLTILATQAADTALVNATGGAASPTAVSIGSCSAAGNALTYNTSTHAFGCNTISSAGLTSKTGSLSRDPSASSGSVSYTGVGFVPTSCRFDFSASDGSTAVTIATGYTDSSKAGRAYSAAVNTTTPSASNKVGAFAIIISGPGDNQAANNSTATLSSYDSDGFTLAWTKNNSPLAGAQTVNYECFK